MPKLIGVSPPAQSDIQVRQCIFKHPAHLGAILNTWAPLGLSFQDVQFSTFSLLVTSQPRLILTFLPGVLWQLMYTQQLILSGYQYQGSQSILIIAVVLPPLQAQRATLRECTDYWALIFQMHSMAQKMGHEGDLSLVFDVKAGI